LCYILLPGSIGYGQVTPANYKLPYRTNGLTAYLITHAIFAVVCVIPATREWLGTASSNPLANNWCVLPPPAQSFDLMRVTTRSRGGILVMANLYGYSLAVYRCLPLQRLARSSLTLAPRRSYFRASLFPTHPEVIRSVPSAG
jgi:hypothetical protein